MSTPTYTEVHDVDGDTLTVTAWAATNSRGIIASTDGTMVDLDREGAVRLIEALTNAVEAADAREAAKLKRGDVVASSRNSGYRYTVTRDDVAGYVDIVCVLSPGNSLNGRLYEHQYAASYAHVTD